MLHLDAGVVELGRVAEQSHEIWTHTLGVTVVAPAELTALLLPRLPRSKSSRLYAFTRA